jgi:hypothetical protein
VEQRVQQRRWRLRHQLPLRLPALSVAAITVVVAGLMACGGGTTTAALPHCAKPPAGIGPDATATLQLSDNGSTVCLASAATLTVLLHAPPGEAPWSAPMTSNPGILTSTPNGALALPIGVTGAAFRARERGIATISAVRSPCTTKTIATCDAGHHWRARIVVH